MIRRYSELIFLFLWAESILSLSDIDSLYPMNSLDNAGSVFPFGGSLPSPRVHHTLALTSNYLIVYGGYDSQGTVLVDVNLHHLPSQTWSNPLNRSECCNDVGEGIDLIGLQSSFDYPYLKSGFQGDYPLPRAEHTACGLNEQMIVFGGVTDTPLHPPNAQSDFEHYAATYLNDVYVFNPLQVRWKEVVTKGERVPSPRAGHTMACLAATHSLYVFGGRGYRHEALSDLWAFDTVKRAWRELTSTGSASLSSPLGRHYAASTITNNQFLLYGGSDPSTGLIFNDLWSYPLPIGGGEGGRWKELSPLSLSSVSSSYSYSPPGLIHAHLFPTDGGVLLYGGMGGGGGMYQGGGLPPAPLSLLGQLYFYSFSPLSWIQPLIDVNDLPLEGENNTCSYCCARLHSSLSAPSVSSSPLSPVREYRGEYKKSYAYEQAVYSPVQHIVYEYGGLLATAQELLTNGQQVGLEGTAEGGVREVSKARESDAGQFIPSLYADVHTGEVLRVRVPLLGNGFWDVDDAVGAGGKVEMVRGLREFSLAGRDMVLIREQSLD